MRLIGLSIRTGIGLREIETYDAATIRQYCAVLKILNAPRTPKPEPVRDQTPDQMMAAFGALTGSRPTEH